MRKSALFVEDRWQFGVQVIILLLPTPKVKDCVKVPQIVDKAVYEKRHRAFGSAKLRNLLKLC